MNTSTLVCNWKMLAAINFALAATAMSEAGVSFGTRAIQNSSVSVVTNTDFGVVPGNYNSSVVGPWATTSSSLVWGPDITSAVTNSQSSFTGRCSGYTTTPATPSGLPLTMFATSDAVMLMTLSSQSSFTIIFNMANVQRAGNEVSWFIADAATGDSVYGLGFETDGTTVVAAGGVPTSSANGTFTGMLHAGSYILAMGAVCNEIGGEFSFDATMTAVPAPSALALLACAGAIGQRRRRSCRVHL